MDDEIARLEMELNDMPDDKPKKPSKNPDPPIGK